MCWLATAGLTAFLASPAIGQAQPAVAAKPGAPPPAKPVSPPKPGHTVDEIIVPGTAPPVRTSIDRQSYSVTNDLQATTGSIADALRNVPSVEVDVQGNVSLRGDPNVTIYIDGKPSGQFRGENKAQALQSLPAGSIDRVEVITNPSAAFNPEGTAGIINLITKKTAKPGVSGGASVNVGSGGRQNGGANAAYRAGKVTISGNAYGRHESQKQAFESVRTFADPLGGGQVEERRRVDASGRFNLSSVRVGADYDPDPKTRIGLELDYTGFNFQAAQPERVTQTGANGALRLGYDALAGFNQDRSNLETTLNYRHKMGDDHELSVSVVSELTDEDRDRAVVRMFRVPATPTTFDDPVYRNYLRRVQVKVDYSAPLPGAVKLKVGYEFDGDDNDYRLVYGRSIGGAPLFIDATRSNLFRFDQQVHAAYATYERPIGKLTALAGLRVEATQIDLNQVTQGLKSSNDYVRFYPSLHLGYDLSEHQKLSGSYSHRVQRPQPQDYNAFRVFGDIRNLYQGNPNLKPQQSDSFELGYQYRKQGTVYLATGYYRRGHDAVNDVFRDLGGGVILQTRENIGSFQTAGMELVANGRLPGKFSYNVSGNLLWSEIDGGNLGPGVAARSLYTATGRGALNWSPTDKDFFQVQGLLQGKTLLTQGYRTGVGLLNLGYRHKFNSTFSGIVIVNDVLSSTAVRSVVRTPDYAERTHNEVSNRAVFVGCTYTFGGGRQRDPGFDFGGGAPGG
jgi:outer membrane receptor protein involved in Fe transport